MNNYKGYIIEILKNGNVVAYKNKAAQKIGLVEIIGLDEKVVKKRIDG